MKIYLAMALGLSLSAATALADTYRIDAFAGNYPTLNTVVGAPVMAPAPAYVAQSPVVYEAFSPVVPTITYYTAPAPVVTYYSPAPTVVYSPVAPAVVYRPVVPVRSTVYYPGGAVVRQKTYFRGQPVRNTLRALAP